MSARNIIQMTFDEFGKVAGGAKRSGSWRWRGAETVFVLNLQKSQYAPQYYVNVGLWFLSLGPAETPKDHQCPIRTRLDKLVPSDEEARLTTLLDLESPVDDEMRRAELLALLRSVLLPLMDATSTLEGLRAASGQRFVRVSLVDGDAERLLASGG